MKDLLKEKLRHILTEPAIKLEDKKVFIWGTGNTALLYQEGLIRLEKEGFQIEAYCDNNMKKFGVDHFFCGKPVLSFDELPKDQMTLVLICTPQPDAVKAISAQLQDSGILVMHIDEAIFKLHADEVMECYESLSDELSKNIYAQLVYCRMNGIYPAQSLVCREEQYFCLQSFMKPDPEEVFVDCGAFTGDTVESFVRNRGGYLKK